MKYYKSIDELPLFNYSKVIKTNDLRYLIISGDYDNPTKLEKNDIKKLFKAWEIINDEVITLIGITDEAKQIMRLERSIALLKVEMITNDDKSLSTVIEIKERELLLSRPINKSTIEEITILLELRLHMQIDVHKTSVEKFYNYIKVLKKNIE
jgi:hypothetical protein